MATEAASQTVCLMTMPGMTEPSGWSWPEFSITAGYEAKKARNRPRQETPGAAERATQRHKY